MKKENKKNPNINQVYFKIMTFLARKLFKPWMALFQWLPFSHPCRVQLWFLCLTKAFGRYRLFQEYWLLLGSLLWKRKVIVVNGCPIVFRRCLSYCIKEVESMVHLLVNCSFARSIWTSIISWFDFNWVLPNFFGVFV